MSIVAHWVLCVPLLVLAVWIVVRVLAVVLLVVLRVVVLVVRGWGVWGLRGVLRGWAVCAELWVRGSWVARRG